MCTDPDFVNADVTIVLIIDFILISNSLIYVDLIVRRYLSDCDDVISPVDQ